MKRLLSACHLAWPVDFNLALRSFEQNILGVRQLIDFSLGSPFAKPPSLIYASSIGVFQSKLRFEYYSDETLTIGSDVTGEVSLLETPIDATVAAGSGYTQSKWVSEEILRKTAKLTSVESLVVRVGQLCGGINGAWNAQEWLPALVQSAKLVGGIPDDDRVRFVRSLPRRS